MPREITAKGLAKRLGISRATFYARRKEPGAPKGSKALDYEAWAAYLARVRVNDPSDSAPRNGKGNGHGANGHGGSDYHFQRTRRTRLAADLLELELQATRRNVVAKEEIKAAVAHIATVARARLMRLRADLPCALVGRTEPEIERIVGNKVEEVLADLALPETFFEPQGRV